MQSIWGALTEAVKAQLYEFFISLLKYISAWLSRIPGSVMMNLKQRNCLCLTLICVERRTVKDELTGANRGCDGSWSERTDWISSIYQTTTSRPSYTVNEGAMWYCPPAHPPSDLEDTSLPSGSGVAQHSRWITVPRFQQSITSENSWFLIPKQKQLCCWAQSLEYFSKCHCFFCCSVYTLSLTHQVMVCCESGQFCSIISALKWKRLDRTLAFMYK